jgi:hypothetical protein
MRTTMKAIRSGKICLAQNCLLWTESTRQMWIDFDRHLDEFGARLVLLSTVEPETPPPFPVLPIPFFLRDYAGRYRVAGGAGGPVSAADLAMLQADSFRANHEYPPGEALRGLFACRQLYATVLEALQPGHVLAFDPTCPLAQVLGPLAAGAGLPAEYIERGLLPETLMIETRGIQAWSDLRTHWLAQDMPAAADEAAAYERIRAYYLTHRPQKYAQAEFGGGGVEIRRRLGLEGKKVVVFLGGGWEADGHAPRGGAYERHFFTGFPTTLEALLALCGCVKQMPGTALVFKPHPLDKQSYAVAKLMGAQLVGGAAGQEHSDVNVHALIEAADVVAAQFTTLQFEAALYDKPVLLLARSAWWGRQAAYEVETAESLPAALSAAVERRDWPGHQARARTFITWMMDQFLIGCTDRAPARRNLRDFARFIAATSLDARGLAAPEVRWERTVQAVEALKAAGRPGPVNGATSLPAPPMSPHATHSPPVVARPAPQPGLDISAGRATRPPEPAGRPVSNGHNLSNGRNGHSSHS